MSKELKTIVVPSQEQSNTIQGSTEEQLNIFEKVVDWLMSSDPQKLNNYVNKIWEQNPGMSREEIAAKIVRRKSHKNGLVGAATGIPGMLALPVTVPADLVASWKIQIHMTLSIAYLYGHTHETTDLKTDVYLILAGNAAKDALKRAGIEVGKEVTKKAIQKHITRDIMKKLWKVVGRKVITKAGEKSTISFMKLVPLVGAPVGYGFDWLSARAVGANAIKYYSGKG